MLSCVGSLLPVSSLQRWKTTCPYPPQSRVGNLPAFHHKSISTSFLLPPPNGTQGKQKFRHSCPGACVTDPHAHRLFVFTGSENSSPSPSRVSPAQRWGSGWEFGTRPRHAAAPAAPRTGDAVPAAEAEWGPPAPGERAEPKDRGWMCVILPCTFVAKALGGRVREPLVCSLVTPG